MRNPQSISKTLLSKTYMSLADGQPSSNPIIAYGFPTDNQTNGNAGAAGNDDSQSKTDEADDPYSDYTDDKGGSLSHLKGQIASIDAPAPRAWAHWATALGVRFELDFDFKEFCRIEIKNPSRTNGKFWFLISDEILWHHSIRVISAPNTDGTQPFKWINNGSKSGLGACPPSN